MRPLEFIVMVLIVILIAAGIILLQIYLSRKENKWLGLILPLIALCAAIFLTFVTPFYVTSWEQTGIVEHVETGSGEVIEKVITNGPQQSTLNIASPDIATVIITSISLFALYNIPTAILLLIYAACRVKRKRDAEMEKMNVQDL